MTQQEEVKTQPYDLVYGFDSSTGLRTATFTLLAGVPEQFLGKYEFKEWTYGEKLRCELDAEVTRSAMVEDIKRRLTEDSEALDEFEKIKLRLRLKRLETGYDAEGLIILQTITTLRASPIPIHTREDFESLPGRVGTMFTNIVGFLNIAPDSEKKG